MSVCRKCGADDRAPSGYCRPCKKRIAAAVDPAKKSEIMQRWTLKRKLEKAGLPPDWYETTLRAQNGVCAICLRPPEQNTHGNFQNVATRRFAFDHDKRCCPYKEGCARCIRALICNGCNLAIGHLKEDAEALHRAAAYVEKWHERIKLKPTLYEVPVLCYQYYDRNYSSRLDIFTLSFAVIDDKCSVV